jgi:Lon protease-like protein
LTYNVLKEEVSVSMTVPQMALPEIIPVFPLTGVMLLPGSVLPLHVFEPRYRNMIEDALQADKIFGMIQPFAPQDDNRGPPPGVEGDAPELYKVGCAGYIEQSEKLPDGRYFVQLKGVNRFRWEDELPLRRGYRRVRGLYESFPDAAPQEDWRCDRDAVLGALAAYGEAHGMQVKPEHARRFSDLELVNLLSVSLPFHPAEKQALLESVTLQDRENVLVDLLRLGAGSADPDPGAAPRTLN